MSAAVHDLAARWADELRAEGDQEARGVDPRDDSWMTDNPDLMPVQPRRPLDGESPPDDGRFAPMEALASSESTDGAAADEPRMRRCS